MAKEKKIKAKVKLNIVAGKATPAPPVGPALGQHGVPLMDFCKEFNAKTSKMGDSIIPVVLTVYDDRSFTFVIKTPLTSDLIRKALGISKGSSTPNKAKAGTLSTQQVEEIAKVKLPDLNATSLEQAVKIVTGSAKSMGVEVK